MLKLTLNDKTVIGNIYSSTLFNVEFSELEEFFSKAFDYVFTKYYTLGCNYMFDSIHDVHLIWQHKLSTKILPYIKLFNNDGHINFESTDTGNSQSNGTSNYADERQPLNANILEITSPTSKTKSVNNASASSTFESAYNKNRKIEMIYKYDNFVELLDSTFKELLYEYNTIY